MQRDRRRVRDVEAGESALRGDAAETVAMLARELTQAFAFGAEHQRERPRQASWSRARRFLPRRAPRADSRARQARRELCARFFTRTTGTMSSAPLAALASAPVSGGLCRSVRISPEAPKAAAERNDRADILRVGHLVEHEHHAVWTEIIETGRWQRLGLEHHALMHGVRPQQAVEVSGTCRRRRDLARGEGRAQALARRSRWPTAARPADPDWRAPPRPRAAHRARRHRNRLFRDKAAVSRALRPEKAEIPGFLAAHAE